MDDASCGYCGALRALLHCAEHAARLCLPCDVTVHAAAPDHLRAPLCDGCHAAPAAERCVEHQASLCAACALTAGCEAECHSRRRARTYRWFPEPDKLARILSFGTPPPSPPPPPETDTWVPDLVNIEVPAEQLSNGAWDNANTMISELPSDSFLGGGGNFDDQIGEEIAGSSSACLLRGDGDEFLAQQDWPNLNDAALGDFDFATHHSNLPNSVNPIGHTEAVFEASASLGYDHPLISSCSETIMPSDAVLQSLTSNSAACHFSSVSTNTSSNVVINPELPHGNFYANGLPMLHRDEFPSRHFGFEVPPGSSAVSGYQDQEAAPPEKPSQDMEARTKLREKREQAKQRYNDKKKNRRFGKQIMYLSRKARADTRNRVKGRFAKASSTSSAHGDNPETQS